MTEERAVSLAVKNHWHFLIKYSGLCATCGKIFYASVSTSTICSTKCRRGELTSLWRGGRRQTADGYILLLRPSHPRCKKVPYVPEHILVMEKHLGRYLRPNETVHHKNGIRNDNRIRNLELMTAHPPGQKVNDLVVFVVRNYPELVKKYLR